MKNKLPFWLTFLVWLPSTLATLTGVFLFQAYRSSLTEKKQTLEAFAQETSAYEMYASYRNILQETDFQLMTPDEVALLVKDYLQKNNSPMVDAYQDLIDTARKYEIDPLLLVSIAQCESNLGKKMPQNCYNPFGWGIHKAGTLCFSSWKEGFDRVAQGLRENYLDEGLVTPDKIMYKYNYASATERDGSWGKCVKQFLNELQDLR